MKTICFILIVMIIGALFVLYGLYNEQERLSTGQTLEIEADIAINPVQSEYETILMNVSAYCPCEKCCGAWADGQTASGHRIQLGDRFVAAPPEYPFGTIMDVSGYGKVPVLDRGGAIKGNKLDVFYPTHQEALIFGRRQLKVKVWR